MTQEWSTNFFDGDNVWSTDLQNIENALFTLRSQFSGTTAPANPLQFAPWGDTGKGVLKTYTGSTWNGLMHGDVSQKLWVYRNAALVGWVVDATVSDRVLAFKGGTTYTAGGAAAGSWTHAHAHSLVGGSHVHKTYDYVAGASSNVYNSSGNAVPVSTALGGGAGSKSWCIWEYNTLSYEIGLAMDTWSAAVAPAVTGAITANSAWRPSASVGTLQNLDI